MIVEIEPAEMAKRLAEHSKTKGERYLIAAHSMS
jgi:hypothetical protein